MNSRRFRSLTVTCGLLLSTSCQHQEPEIALLRTAAKEVQFEERSEVDLIEVASGQLQAHRQSAPKLENSSAHWSYQVVVFESSRDAIAWSHRQEDVRDVQVLSPRVRLVAVAPQSALGFAASAGVHSVLSWTPEFKLSPALQTGFEVGEQGGAALVVDSFADADAQALADAATRHGARVVASKLVSGADSRRSVITVGSGDLVETARDLANLPETRWVAPRRYRQLLNDTSVWVGQGGIEAMSTPIFEHGILGQGQIGALLDTGVDYDHCQFSDDKGAPTTNVDLGTDFDASRRKIIAYDFLWDSDDPSKADAFDNQGHGSHVAGTIAGDLGDAGVHDEYDGMAPAAQLVVQDGGYGPSDTCADLPGIGCPVVDLKPIFQQAYDQGARVHSNSWGDREDLDVQNDYTDACEDVDRFTWEHPDFLIVFAAGNSGSAQGTVGSPSIAKSAVSVAATLRAADSDALTGFSSRGPTADNRYKPDVAFPGSNIVSAANDGDISTNNCSSRSSSGTSMAAPGVAGLSLLVRQYYTDGFYPGGESNPKQGFSPSAALMKATLIGATVPMTEEVAPPSIGQGWGRVQLDRALAFDDGETTLFIDDHRDGFEAGSEEELRYRVTIEASSGPFRATLVWSDYPATAAAKTSLVNDLDLSLVAGADTYLGNVIEAGQSVVGGDADRLNNVEQIRLDEIAPGDYELVVQATTIAQGPQGFALVVTGAASVEAELDDDGSSTESTQTSATSNVSESNSDSSDSVSTSEQVSSSAGSNADTSAASSSGESASGSGSDDQIYPDQKSGCACRSVPPRGGWWGTALLSGLVLSIRRRRRHVKTRRTIAQRV